MRHWNRLFHLVCTVTLMLAMSSSAALAAEAGTAREYFTDLPLVTHEGEEVHFYSCWWAVST